MTKLDFDGHEFRPSEIPLTSGFEPLPAAWYRMMIAKAEVKPTKDGQGRYLKLELAVLDGDPYGGRRVFENLNLWHSNPETVRIAEQGLRRICDALGLARLSDSDELVGHTICCKLKIKEAKGDYDAANKVVDYRPLDGSAPATPAAPASPPPAGSPTPGKAPPWARRA